jgi:hypothetical protein
MGGRAAAHQRVLTGCGAVWLSAPVWGTGGHRFESGQPDERLHSRYGALRRGVVQEPEYGHKPAALVTSASCSAARSARPVWVGEAAGSNPASSTG